MKLTPLLEAAGTDKTAILKLQQEVLEQLPDDVDVEIESHPNPNRVSKWRLRCKVPGYYGSVVVADQPATKPFCYYIVAMLLKDKLKRLGFDNRTGGRYFLSRPDNREYSCVLRITNIDNGDPPFKIIARHRFMGRSAVYAIATVYSLPGLDKALKYLDEFDVTVLDVHDPNQPAVQTARSFD